MLFSGFYMEPPKQHVVFKLQHSSIFLLEGDALNLCDFIMNVSIMFCTKTHSTENIYLKKEQHIRFLMYDFQTDWTYSKRRSCDYLRPCTYTLSDLFRIISFLRTFSLRNICQLWQELQKCYIYIFSCSFYLKFYRSCIARGKVRNTANRSGNKNRYFISCVVAIYV